MANQGASFLEGIELRPVADESAFNPLGLALGSGNLPLEVVVAESAVTPSLPSLRSAWKARKAGRASPVLLVVLYADKAALCGPAGEDAPAYVGLDRGQVERICREALGQPDRHAALRALRDSLPAVESELGGVRNEGFLATHELRVGTRAREDWEEARAKAIPILGRRGTELLANLGFEVEPCDRVTSILHARDRKVAVAVLLSQSESPELQAERFSDLSPIAYALAVADRENLPYVVLQHGAKIRIYPTKVGVGVGRRGRTETYVECHTGLLRDADAAYLWLLCSVDALAAEGTLEQLVEASGRYAGDLAERLRERVYQCVVPVLAEGIVLARGLDDPDATDLADTYEMTLTVLFRFLFIAYGEDKDLLPYRWNGLYQRRSIKTKAQELLELVREGVPFDESDSLWDEVTRLFRAVSEGNREWGVPAYNGGLFSSEPDISQVGSLLAEITLPNTVVGPALRDLLLVESPEGLGPVDFRSLGVREFGTIYEGLLESELSVAETDLTVDEEGLYRPCIPGEAPLVHVGGVYLHNASGARKSTGSFFTKAFAVEHLLERSLGPALGQHLARLDAIEDPEEAGEMFFDFRVADIAMGSGHFLVATVDHIERALSGYLSTRTLPPVAQEIASLRVAALNGLGSLADQVEIEDTQLLRRLIARRCIYGIDINATAVQLARLAVWIHTFVPGLPLSLLDHNLVQGNSLVGIAQLAEVQEKAEEASLPMFPIDAQHMLGEAGEHLGRLARLADGSLAELRSARDAQLRAMEAIKPSAALFDIVTACRIDSSSLPIDVNRWEDLKGDLPDSLHHQKARDTLTGIDPFHFPIAFPEVFLRERAGFDVIVGNPPWKAPVVHEVAFWARHFPGLRGLTQEKTRLEIARLEALRPDLAEVLKRETGEAAGMRRALTSGGFPGMGTGDPDYYKAFCWRFWRLVTDEGGRIGVVLPRSALAAKGSTEFRFEVFEHGDDVDITTLTNTKGWVFDDAEHRYTIGLVALTKREAARTPVALRGPYPSLARYRSGMLREPSVFYGDEIKTWNDTASLPLLPT